MSPDRSCLWGKCSHPGGLASSRHREVADPGDGTRPACWAPAPQRRLPHALPPPPADIPREGPRARPARETLRVAKATRVSRRVSHRLRHPQKSSPSGIAVTVSIVAFVKSLIVTEFKCVPRASLNIMSFADD